MTSPDEKNRAFEQFIREMFDLHPLTPNDRSRHDSFLVNEMTEDYRVYMLSYARTGSYKSAVGLAEAAKLPKEQVEAMAVLIYG
jgi:hypothetical protein